MNMIEKNPSTEAQPSLLKKILRVVLSVPITAICLVVTLILLSMLLGHVGTSNVAPQNDVAIMDKFDQYVTNEIMTKLGDFMDVERVYWLDDNDQVAPKPNPANFGETDDPSSLQWLLDEAADLLDGQETLFSTDVEIIPGSVVSYYLDETILAIAWKQGINGCVYTFSEVKIAHPTQFRRFLSEGQYGSGVLHTTSEMAASVNAVAASAADYYSYRAFGVLVNNGTVFKNKANTLDTCFIDDKGDLLFATPEDLAGEGVLEQYIADHNVRFSISFGPILLVDGEYQGPYRYPVGEISEQYSRSALCQLDNLHYAVVTANMERYYPMVPNLRTFARHLAEQGIKKAYTLDGGQTATIVMNNKVFNTVSYGAERDISDIIYFATALPSGQS